MPLFSCGINHQSAPIHIRERLAISPAQIKNVLTDLCQMEAVNEAVLLSTCNRTEIYMAGAHPLALRKWFQAQAANIDIQPHYYLHQDQAAVRHLLRVSSGLDSMVLGEPQILGQIKTAYRMAQEAGTAKQQLQHLFSAAFAASKTIRQQTQIGANAISMAYATVQIAKRIFTHLSHCNVLLIGAGELIELVATHFSQQKPRQIIVANRTIAGAERIALPHGGQSIRIGEIPLYLPQVDIVVTATASQLPIIGKGMIERTLKTQKRRPLLMVDLAVPRDIEPEVAQLADVYLYNIDDLQLIIDANLKNRRQAAHQAETLTELQTEHYMRQLQVTNISDIITRFRRQAEEQSRQAAQKAMIELQRGNDPHQVIMQLSQQLTNKMLHHPTIKLRELAYQQQAEALMWAKQLLIEEYN